MSRVGKKPIDIPGDIKIAPAENRLNIQGKKGAVDYTIPEGLEVKIEENKLTVLDKEQSARSKKLHGLTRTLICNAILGQQKGYEKKLVVTGVGYRVQVQGAGKLEMSVGYSHPVKYTAPAGIQLETTKANEIIIKGSDKKLVGDVAARIKHFCLPEPYKGKGISYDGEKIRRKAGKTVG